jgi:uncharacterized membrane protein YoaK (UPF0700 family)
MPAAQPRAAAMPESSRQRSREKPRLAHLVGLLTFTSGCVDVVTLMAIGGAFTSVITGNLIFIGRAIGTQSLSPAVHAILAVAGYVLGVAAGSRLSQFFGRSAPRGDWPRAATLVLAAEWVTLAAINVAWIAYRAAPPGAATDVLLPAASLALGLQGAAARGVKGNPSTTYMTGALTALVEALSTGGRRSADASAVVGLVALIAGAAASAVLVDHAARWALLPPLASLLLVIAIKARHHRAEGRAAREAGQAAPAGSG